VSEGGSEKGRTETATLGGGCFWCMDAVFRRVRGVESVTCGYAGGQSEDPDYEAVCRGDTGHAEVVRVEFDPDVVSYRELLEIFFGVHDPTTPNRQGPDVGSQYRSIVLAESPEQERTARETMAELEEEGIWDAPLVTEVEPLETFYPAEDYHQDYFRKNPEQGYCRAVVAPKVQKLRRTFRDHLKDAS